jgi:hypothetical protein
MASDGMGPFKAKRQICRTIEVMQDSARAGTGGLGGRVQQHWLHENHAAPRGMAVYLAEFGAPRGLRFAR